MRSRLFSLARACAAVLFLGLTACADQSAQTFLHNVVTAMKDAQTANPSEATAKLARNTDSADATPTQGMSRAAPEQSGSAPKPTAPVAAAQSAPKPPASKPINRAASPDVAALQQQLDELESRVASLTAENQRQMERLTLITNGAIADMEQLFSSLRLELRSAPGSETAAPRRRRTASGQGGPFLPWPPAATPAEAPTAQPVEPLLPDLKTLFLLHQIAVALPLSAPLDAAVVTGPFGYRRDPFNSKPAFHEGIDLQAPMRSAIHATAGGTVVVAGIRPAYGRVVEIDHGFGIRTRYAHLASVAVHEGDHIDRHAIVGTLGSSGRSASPHLHYEVLFNGRPHDPADLLVLAEGIHARH